MARFKALEQYGKNFSDLASVGYHYQGEVGTSGVREAALKGPLGALQKAMAAARNNQMANRTPQSTSVKGVKALADFHTGQQSANKVAEQNRLNQKVVWLRQWLSRQGAWFTGLDELNWKQTMRLKVVYDAELRQQKATEVNIVGGRLYVAGGGALDTAKMVTHFSGPGYGIYVMSNTGKLYVHSHSVGHYHHSSLLAGGQVACAGELKVNNGQIEWLSNKSGHYTPGRAHLLQVLGMLQDEGVPLTFSLEYMSATGKTPYSNVAEFMVAEMLDDDNYELAQQTVISLASSTGSYYDPGSGGGSVGASTYHDAPTYGQYHIPPTYGQDYMKVDNKKVEAYAKGVITAISYYN